MKTFPNHPMFAYARQLDELRAERNRDWGRKPWVAIVASQGYEPVEQLTRFCDQLAEKYPGTTVIIPKRKAGAGKIVALALASRGFKLLEVESEVAFGPQSGGIHAQNIVNLADVVAVFHAGGADLAKAVAARALLTHRPPPQFEPGLHVWTMQKTRVTKSQPKAKSTGKVKYATRKDGQLVVPKAKAA